MECNLTLVSSSQPVACDLTVVSSMPCQPHSTSSETHDSTPQETKRALNLHLQDYILRAAPFALSAESESFSTDDIKATIDNFTKK